MRPDEIIVRLVDGRNGKRVEYEVASIWLGDAKSASNLLADKGEVAVEVDSAQPRDIRVTPNFFVDCVLSAKLRIAVGGGVAQK
jgi:hypothetical protein